MMKNVEAKHIELLISALFVAMVPHMPRLPLWIVFWCLLLWGYVILAIRKNWPWSALRLRFVLIGLGFFGILITSGKQFGGSTYLSLLAIMATLKPMEIRSHRDEMVTLFLAYFIIITSLLESESLLITLYMFVSVFYTTAVLIYIHQPEGKLKSTFKLSWRIMAQALPLMVVLFFLFPRIEGSFWGLVKKRTAKSGFSDSLSPGDISKLVLSNEVAFRARFDKAVPKPDYLYWRGLVLWNFDGRKWSVGIDVPRQVTPVSGERTVTYHVSLEPHGNKWFFALDLPVSKKGRASLFEDYTLRYWKNLRQKVRYSVESVLEYQTGPLEEWEKAALSLPEEGNTKARKLAQKWRDTAGSSEEIVELGLDFFRANQFVYTLKPPLLGEDRIDDFLFRKRKGYCEHYASSFAYLMRAAGIPSRVIAGYLGGERNPYADFIVVQQIHAHAWVEVWLPNRGWIRIDPTSTVAPERVEMGPAGALQAEELPDSLSEGRYAGLHSFRLTVRYGWEAINNQWDIWFSGYSYLEQQAFLEKLGMKTGTFFGRVKALLLLIGMILVLVIVFLIWQFRKAATPRDITQMAYVKFCAKLDSIGISRAPAQGPDDFAKKVRSIKKSLAPQVDEITGLYARIRYAGETDKHVVQRFKTRVRQFDPKHIKKIGELRD